MSLPALEGKRLVHILKCHQLRHWIDELDNFEPGTPEEETAISELRVTLVDHRQMNRMQATTKCCHPGEGEMDCIKLAARAEDEV